MFQGVEAVGFPKITSGIIKPIDLVHFHYEKSNNELETLMKKDRSEETTIKFETEKFLRQHVENRLRMNIPYLKKWPEALGEHLLFRLFLNLKKSIPIEKYLSRFHERC